MAGNQGDKMKESLKKEFPIGEEFLFIHSFPATTVSIVKILRYHTDNDQFYIRKESGGSDSTTADFLCPITGKIKELKCQE